MGLYLAPFDSRSADGRPMWMEEKVLSLSSSNFSISWSLFYNIDYKRLWYIRLSRGRRTVTALHATILSWKANLEICSACSAFRRKRPHH
jgi:hypothetical protein